MRNKFYALTLLTIALTIAGCASAKFVPKTLDVKGDYVHKKAKTIFPEQVKSFTRSEMYVFNPEETDIGANYNLGGGKVGDPVVTVYVYPAAAPNDGRIIESYLEAFQGALSHFEERPIISHRPIVVEKDGFRVVGVRGTATLGLGKFNTMVVVFECGKYLLKYRISSQMLDTNGFNKIVDDMMTAFSPIDIVRNNPINTKNININVNFGMFSDSVSSAMFFGAAAAKSLWATSHVDSLEQLSGFPTLYFEEQKETQEAIIKMWEELKRPSSELQTYFDGLAFIKSSGFLDEFIVDQFGGLLITPPDLKLDMEEYAAWRDKYKPNINLLGQSKYFLLGFGE